MEYYQPHLNKNFIGRLLETERLQSVASTSEAAIVVVYGRRRVGKTELIEQAYRNRNLIKLEGIEGQNEQYQREALLAQIARYSGQSLHAKLRVDSWRDFFDIIYALTKEGTHTLYFEEVQWIANYQNTFVAELKYYWDNFFRHNPDLIIVLCGSAPSFMVNKVVKSKALYNRSLHEIPLQSFTFDETKTYLGKNRNLRDLMDVYLSVGGIPEYLRYLKGEASFYKALCEQSFRAGGFFTGEWDRIFVSSLAGKPYYKEVVSFLATQKFATRNKIISSLKLTTGGEISKVLMDLEQCGFIQKYLPYQASEKSTLVRYCIHDHFLHFHARFIKPIAKEIARGDYNVEPMSALSIEQFNQWLGYAFERLCRAQHKRIAKVIGFSAVHYKSGSFYNRSSAKADPGFQLDLVFNRKDRVITVCEIKYTKAAPSVSVGRAMEEKVNHLRPYTKATIERVLITAEPPTPSLKDGGYFDHVITLQDLFG